MHNAILYLLLCALYACVEKATNEAASPDPPMYQIALEAIAPDATATSRAPSQQPQRERKRASTCLEEVPLPYKDDARARGTLIVVYKSMFRLGLYKDGRLVSVEDQRFCFPIAMGSSPETQKTMRDNASTPEGWYRIGSKRDVGETNFYKALHIDYPNQEDVERAFAQEIVTDHIRKQLLASIRAGAVPSQGTDMGGWVMIHGYGSIPNSWTAGCVALDNENLDLLFPHVSSRGRILIIPWGTVFYENL